jgi:hypothetical protein
MRVRWLVSGAVVALVGAGALVAATDDAGGPRTTSLHSERPSLAGVPDRYTAEPDAVVSTSLPPASRSPGNVAARIDQKVVRTADLTVEVGKGRFQEVFREATGVAGLHGGFVASSNTAMRDGKLAMGTLEIRVPAASFEAARSALGRLGKVTDERISGQDVGAELVDIEARLRSLAAEEEALRALMARARTVGETVEVQRQLTNVREQIEQLAGQKARLDDSVAMSTIRATVTEPGVAVREEPSETSLSRSLDRAIDGALAVVGGTIVVLGYALPLSALIALAWLVYRWVARRHGPAVSG